MQRNRGKSRNDDAGRVRQRSDSEAVFLDVRLGLLVDLVEGVDVGSSSEQAFEQNEHENDRDVRDEKQHCVEEEQNRIERLNSWDIASHSSRRWPSTDVAPNTDPSPLSDLSQR